jgi:hypothetical protein
MIMKIQDVDDDQLTEYHLMLVAGPAMATTVHRVIKKAGV